MGLPPSIEKAMSLPAGARFYRCALQVNPFAYAQRHSRTTAFPSEGEYNTALVHALKDNGIEVIAITDHQRCSTGQSLAAAARAEGLIVFPGAEVETKEGVHMLLLFEPDAPWERCNGVLGDCGIHDQANPPKNIKYDVQELLRESRKWGCICIAAHVAGEKGLLRAMDNQARMAVWNSEKESEMLLACSVPGPAEDAPENLRPILLNKNSDYHRNRPMAVINAKDITGPDDLTHPGASCWIKMSYVSVGGLRQAFLDPESRIRLNSDPEPEDHTEFVAAAWQSGGFLDGAAIHFNQNLNILVGGRGAGKSTMVESLRYVLGIDPIGADAQKAHEGIVRNVLKSGTKISLLIQAYQPSRRRYLIERTVPNPPVVRDETGKLLELSPADILPQVEVYGQHEISELTKSPEKLTRLLHRFLERDDDLSARKRVLLADLERSRSRILESEKDISQIQEELARLPALEETLKSYKDAGLEETLKEQSLLVREERVLKTADERVIPFVKIIEELKQELSIDRAFLSEKALEGLPGKEILMAADGVLNQLHREMQQVYTRGRDSVERAAKALSEIRQRWDLRKQQVQEAYEKILRDLQKSKIDGEAFIRLRRQIEGLRPLKERKTALLRDMTAFQDERRNLLAEWEDVKAEEFRRLERAAKKVSRKLKDRVLVEVAAAGNREPLAMLMRELIGGRLSEAIDTLSRLKDFSLPAFAEACRRGRDELVKSYQFSPSQAEKIAAAGLNVFFQIEALDLPPTTTIKLNVAAEGDPSQWQELDALSTGQKATAVLLLLLLESNAPLVVDQPEDDLDNRFITDGIVPKMREEKRRRQFIFATHNANIPVLGDAELIVGLSAAGEAEHGRASLSSEHMGSIDNPKVSELVKEILEGGQAAFETRRLKYGF
jgi:energy-coupling factor transporter ATP-binding protein EcfA2